MNPGKALNSQPSCVSNLESCECRCAAPDAVLHSCLKKILGMLWSPKCYVSPTESFESASTRFLNVLIDSITNNSNNVSAFLISQARLNKTGLIGACTFINR